MKKKPPSSVRDLRRAQILEVARRIVVEQGLEALTFAALEERLDGGLRPKLLYVIPEYQNPTGRTLPLDRREALVEL